MIIRMWKAGMLSGALALCLTSAGCASAASEDSAQDDQAEREQAIAPRLTCDQLCQSEGGQFFRSILATSAQQCAQKGGSWFDPPDPGCCCKCALLSGGCL